MSKKNTSELMDLTEVVNRLVGPIRPVGEANTDNHRFENLKVMCDLVDKLVTQIDYVAFTYKDSYAYSEQRASEYAKNFLTDTLGIKE